MDAPPQPIVGTGRRIPVKQGYLEKRRGGLNRDWKRKYVTLTSTELWVYPSIREYMENSNGKAILLMHSTVKMPQSQHLLCKTTSAAQSHSHASSIELQKNKRSFLSGYDCSSAPSCACMPMSRSLLPFDDSYLLDAEGTNSVEGELGFSRARSRTVSAAENLKAPRPGRRFRQKSKSDTSTPTDADSQPSRLEFQVITLVGKSWFFGATSQEERQEWVRNIEKQIAANLELQSSGKRCKTAPEVMESIQCMEGNGVCADCTTSDPEWASLNYGCLLCIECSGAHRHFGTDFSRVRSLCLDDWTTEQVAVMLSIGNKLAREVFEASLVDSAARQSCKSNHQERLEFLKRKYICKEFLLLACTSADYNHSKALFEAVHTEDIASVYRILPHCGPDVLNRKDSRGQSVLHVCAALGNVVLVQLLIWNGCKVDSRDLQHYLPIDRADQEGQTACVKLLLLFGSPAVGSFGRRSRSLTLA